MIRVQCCPSKGWSKSHKEWAKMPCPYAPMGLKCLKHYGHGSPHVIDVEAAYIEKVSETARTQLLGVLSRSEGVESL